MFETTGILDETYLKELSGLMVGRWRTGLTVVVGAFLIMGGILNLSTQHYTMVAIVVVALVMLMATQVYIRRRVVRLHLKRNEEMGLKPEDLEVTVYFDASGAVMINRNKPEKEPMRMGYDLFRNFAETKRLYVLTTKGRLMLTVFKEQLSQEQRTELKQLLREKAVNIKRSKLR